MKKIFVVVLMFTIFTNVCPISMYARNECIDVYIDDKLLLTDQPGIILNGRTLVPIRAICEALGCDVCWDGDSNEVQIWNRAVDIRIKIDSYWMIKSYKSYVPDGVSWYVDNEYEGYYEEIELDVPPMIINGRTLVPARAISEAFYADVKWNDEKRCVEIERKYHEMYGFSEDLAVVKKDDKRGYMDMEGNMVIPFEYDAAESFHKGIAKVVKNNKYGVINSKGNVVVPFEFDYIGDFYQKCEFNNDKFRNIEWIDGYTRAVKDGKFGIIDVKGNVVIPFIYDVLVDLTSEGLAYAKMNGKYGFVDMEGNIAIPFKYDGITPYYKGFSIVMMDGKCGTIDVEGNVVIPLEYNEGYFVIDNNIFYWITKKDDQWGVMNIDGNVLVPFEYDGCFDCLNGFVCLCKNGKWGIVNIDNGNVAVSFAYDSFHGVIEKFSEIDSKRSFVVIVSKSGKYGVIDAEGNIVVPFEYEDLVYEGYSSYIIVKKNSKWGVITIDGHILIPFECDNAEQIQEFGSYFKVETGQQNLLYLKERNYNVYGNIIYKPID